MFFLKKIFFAIIFLYLLIERKIEYFLLRIFRYPINKTTIWLAARFGIRISVEAEGAASESGSSRPTLNEPAAIHHLKLKNPNALIYCCTDLGGFANSYANGWWDSEPLDQYLQFVTTNFSFMLTTPLHFRLRHWILLNGWKRTGIEWAEKQESVVASSIYRSKFGKYKGFFHGSWDDDDDGSSRTNNVNNLDEAQLKTMKDIGHKLKLSPGMRVLDVGCGYGVLANYLATTFQVEVVGCTYSKEEAKLVEAEGPCKIVVSDYRDLKEGKFDRIVCLHLMEHIGGPRKYKSFFRTLSNYLVDDGLILLHTNVGQSIRCGALPRNSEFHSGILPLGQDILNASESLFYVESVVNHGANMAKTYRAFRENLDFAWQNTFTSTTHRDPSIYRAERFSLSLLIALFEMKNFHMWEVVLSKHPTSSILNSSSTIGKFAQIFRIVVCNRKRRLDDAS